MSLVAELRRRSVFKVAAAYLVVGWLLTEVLTTILPELGAPVWAPRAVILIFAFGFIPAVVFSWFYELTPEGIKRDDEVVHDESAPHKTSRKFEYFTVVAVVVLIVIVGLFSARQTGNELPPVADAEVQTASVAVLPFVNMSSDEDNEYFSDGLTETLLHMLAQVPNLQVAARTSSFAFKGQNRSVREIAAALGVAHILEGSVQRAGDSVRITAQLIRASDGFHVWSSSFDRTLDNIFDIQDEIAQKVGFALSESLLGATDSQLASIQTRNPDAYDLYLQARRERATYSYGGLKAAEDLLKGALLIDPDFIEAKTELATSYIHQQETGLMSQQDAFSQVTAICEQVLAVRPDDVVARAVRAYVDAVPRALDGDAEALPRAAQELEALVAEAPDELQVRILLVRTYQYLQQPEKPATLLEDAAKQDPFNPQIHYELGRMYVALERWEDARASLERSLDIEPAQPNAYTILAGISLHAGDGVAYVQHLLKAVEIDPRDHELPGMLVAFLYNLELFEAGDDLRDRVITISPTSEVAYRTEMLRAIRSGDERAALTSARRAIEDGVENRQFTYGFAVQYLLRSAIRTGTLEEEFAWLDEQSPGILDVNAATTPQKHRVAQAVAFDAWYTSLPREELLSRIDKAIQIGESMGFDPEESPIVHLNVLAMRGEIQEAIEVALSGVFSRSVAMNLDWRATFAQAQFAEVVGDPRIQAAMQHWEDEEASLRGQVQTYLSDLMAST